MESKKFDCINLGSNGYSRVHLRGNKVQLPDQTAKILASFYPNYSIKQINGQTAKWIQLWSDTLLYREYQVQQKDLKDININFTSIEEENLVIFYGIIWDCAKNVDVKFEIRVMKDQQCQIPEYIKQMLLKDIYFNHNDADALSFYCKIDLISARPRIESYIKSIDNDKTYNFCHNNIKIRSTLQDVDYYIN